jgi:adenylate kinase family enzyme
MIFPPDRCFATAHTGKVKKSLGHKMKSIIIGNSGSGKTWLANNLASIFSIPIIHFDEIFWKPGGFDEPRKSEDIENMIEQSKLSDSWIGEGVFGDIAERYIKDTQTLIWLDLPWNVCLDRLEKRGSESKRHMNREQSEKGLTELIKWASQYYERQSKSSYFGHSKIFNDFDKTKIRLKSEHEVTQYIKNPTRCCT